VVFDRPIGWQTKTIAESPLSTTFSALWDTLRSTYQMELSQLAFGTIPDEKLIEDSFMKIIQQLAMLKDIRQNGTKGDQILEDFLKTV
jgi:hypothetical protein